MSEDTLKLAQDVQRSHLSTVEAKQVAAALIDIHERMGWITEEAVKWVCNHEDEQDEDSRMCSGDDCKCCYILALTKGKV